MPPIDQLANWCEAFLPSGVQLGQPLQLTPVSGDAGFRCYFRINAQPSLIAVYAPPEHEDTPGFVSKALFLSEGGIHAPRIHAVNYQQGFLLIEDFGNRLLLLELNTTSATELYDRAEASLLTIQELQPPTELFEAYSREKLQQEMDLFPLWFVEGLLGLSLDDKGRRSLQSAYELLLDSALQQPQVIVHRDYHARNLMLLDDKSLGVIDFQGAVVGPVTYDLVSLLRDCYIRWPRQMVVQRVEGFYHKAVAAGVMPETGMEQFLRWFDLMGLQRHLKVLGVFARLWLRDGKQQYLHDLPLVMRYVLEQTASYAELNGFHGWFMEELLPVVQQQDWYQPWETAGEK